MRLILIAVNEREAPSDAPKERPSNIAPDLSSTDGRDPDVLECKGQGLGVDQDARDRLSSEHLCL